MYLEIRVTQAEYDTMKARGALDGEGPLRMVHGRRVESVTLEFQESGHEVVVLPPSALVMGGRRGH